MSFVIILVVFNIVAAFCGWAVDKVDQTNFQDIKYTVLAALSIIAAVLTSVPLIRSCNISLGSPEVPCGFVLVGALINVAICPLLVLLDPAFVGMEVAGIVACLALPLILLAVLNLRGLMLLPLALLALAACATCAGSEPYFETIGNLGVVVSLSVSMFVPYVWDQRMLILLSMSWCVSITIAPLACNGDVSTAILACGLTFVMVYLTELFNRGAAVYPQTSRAASSSAWDTFEN